MIYVGLDDTDMPDTLGTNQLAKALVQTLSDRFYCPFVLRHQLVQDARIPFTRHNSAAAMCLIAKKASAAALLARQVGSFLREHAAPGSDPGFCVAPQVPRAIRAFGRRCQQQRTDQQEARRLATAAGLQLEGLAGTEDGVIGALAAVGLAAAGSDGRIVMIDGRDDLSDVQPIADLRARGVACCRLDSGTPVLQGFVDVGKHLRPSYRQHRAVLYLQRAVGDVTPPDLWTAVRLP